MIQNKECENHLCYIYADTDNNEQKLIHSQVLEREKREKAES